MPKDDPQDDDETTNSFKTSSVTLSDTAKTRLVSSVEKRLEKERTTVSRWDRFKAVITNKDVKTTVKNVGKGYKAVTDSVSKTFDTTSSTAKGFGQSGAVVGGVTQVFETVVDVYLVKQKVDKAKRDLDTVEKAEVQKDTERSLQRDVAKKIRETDLAKRSLTISEHILQANTNIIARTQGKLGDKEKEVDRIEGQLRALETNLRPIPRDPHAPGTGFLDQVQQRLVKDLSTAEAALKNLELDRETQINARLDEMEKIQGQLRALEENIRIAPELRTGTDVYEREHTRLSGKLSNAQSALEKVQQDLDGPISRKKDDIVNMEGKLRGIDENIRALSPEPTLTTGTSLFMEERDRLKKNLTTAQSEIGELRKEITNLEKTGERLQDRVKEKRMAYREKEKELQAVRTEFGASLSKDKLKQRMAEKDLNQYNDDVPLERAKLMKSLLDGSVATSNIIGVSVSGASTVVQEGVKLTGGVFGIVAGPVTLGVNTKDMVNDINGNRTALALKHKASNALAQKDGIKQDDAELLAIAERLRLKQKKNSVDKGLSATKNAFGALGGIGTAASGAAAIAVVVGGTAAAAAAAAAVLTPVGWALAGAAAAAAVGYGVYKLVRHLNSQAIKEALRETIALTNKEDGNTRLSELEGLSKKEAKALDKVAEKCVKALAKEGLIVEKGDLTMDELNSYACKKLLARDTGTATEALLVRFKEEVKAHFGDQPITKEAMEQYLNTESQKVPVDSAVGLMAKLGVGLKAEEAVDLYRDKSQSDALKFMSKKIYSPTKETPAQEKNLSQGVVKVEKGKERLPLGSSPDDGLRSSRDSRLDSSQDDISIQRNNESSPRLERGNSSVRDQLRGSSDKTSVKKDMDLGVEKSEEFDKSGKNSPKLRESFKSGKPSEKVSMDERGVGQKTRV